MSPSIKQSAVMGHGLMARPPVTFIGPPWPQDQDEPVTNDEIEAVYELLGATCSTRTARALAYIRRFAP